MVEMSGVAIEVAFRVDIRHYFIATFVKLYLLANYNFGFSSF